MKRIYLIKMPNVLQFLRKSTQCNEKIHSQHGNSSVLMSLTKTSEITAELAAEQHSQGTSSVI